MGVHDNIEGICGAARVGRYGCAPRDRCGFGVVHGGAGCAGLEGVQVRSFRCGKAFEFDLELGAVALRSSGVWVRRGA